MKVCQIMICKGFGGAERAFVDSCIALDECGHQVLAILDQNAESQAALDKENISYKIIPLRFRQNPLAKIRLKKLLSSYKPDIVHIHLRRSMDFAGRLSQKLGVPVVATVHNYSSIKTYEYADHIIALTQEHRDYIINTNPVLENKTTVIQNFSRMNAKKHNITQHKPIRLLSFGRFVHKKGFDVLIKSYAKLCKDRNDIHLSIVGDGPLKTEIESAITELNLQAKLDLLPWSNNVSQLLDRHDVFVLPSRKEPFGIAVLEAMARGKLIISTKSEGPRQFLDENMALLCEIEDVDDLYQKMLYAMNHLNDLQSMADRANDYYQQHFTKEKVIPLLEQCYNLTLQSHR